MRILFLDDEEMIRDLFREIFGIVHDLTLAGTAEEALEICKNNSFDLIITDVRLPKMKRDRLRFQTQRQGNQYPVYRDYGQPGYRYFHSSAPTRRSGFFHQTLSDGCDPSFFAKIREFIHLQSGTYRQKSFPANRVQTTFSDQTKP